jgi:hypothetical protein
MLVIANGLATIDPVSVEADEFVFGGKCLAGFDQKYTLDGAVKIPTELSAAMVQGVAELQYLYDKDNNISLPIHVVGQAGQAPAISVTQTAIDMGKNAIRNEGKQQLEKILNKVLGGEEQPATSDTQGQQPAQGTTLEKPSPASDIIDGILDKVF